MVETIGKGGCLWEGTRKNSYWERKGNSQATSTAGTCTWWAGREGRTSSQAGTGTDWERMETQGSWRGSQESRDGTHAYQCQRRTDVAEGTLPGCPSTERTSRVWTCTQVSVFINVVIWRTSHVGTCTEVSVFYINVVIWSCTWMSHR